MESYLEKLAAMTILELCEEWDKVMNSFKKAKELEEQKGVKVKREKIFESGGRRFT